MTIIYRNIEVTVTPEKLAGQELFGLSTGNGYRVEFEGFSANVTAIDETDAVDQVKHLLDASVFYRENPNYCIPV